MDRKERRLKIRTLNRQLKVIQAERKFVWKTPKYQVEHTALLNRQEEKLSKELEKIL